MKRGNTKKLKQNKLSVYESNPSYYTFRMAARQSIKKDSRLLFGEVVLTVFAMSALYVILSDNYGTDTQKWAYGVLGCILASVVRLLK